MTVELDNLNAAFDLTEDLQHQYKIGELQNLIKALLYLLDDDNEFEINRQEQLDSLIRYFRDKMKEKNLAIHEIVKQSKVIEVASGRAAAYQYLTGELGKTNSSFVRRILSGFAEATEPFAR